MEMESSRRPAVDRSREPGLKKPRLSDGTAERDRGANGGGTERDRPFAPRDPRGGGQAPNPRSRSTEQEIQELVVQYESALAELTFNSKPIITNLTIIAGENLHAAKGIAATICSHILEVPSEQKLPSLYLLDSIVKNIKGDYIKFFAAKLPEVFCKAYRQVDSSIHPGMRHLFGTWKTVFPLSTLQVIEKELGISSTSNGSSKTTASKPDSQTAQRRPQSIHVNPKYLEARRLQQLSKKAKDTNGDEISRVGDAERFDSASNVGNTKQLPELSSKIPNIQRPHREQLNDPVDEKKSYTDVKHRDHELSRQLLGEEVGRVAEVKERDALARPYYGAIGDGSDIPFNRRSDFDANKAYGTYHPSGSAQTDRQLPLTHLNSANKNSLSSPNNWKNSEEFKWDDISRTLKDFGGANRAIKGGWSSDDVDKPSSLQRDKWTEHLDSPLNKFDTFSKFRKTPGEEDEPPFLEDIKEHLPKPRGELDTDSRVNLDTAPDKFSLGQDASGYQASSVWPPREPPPSVDNLNQFNSRFSGQLEGQHIPHGGMFPIRPGPQSHAIPPSGGPFPGSVGLFGHRPPLRPSSPSTQTPPLSLPVQHQKSQNSFDQDVPQSHSFSQMGQKPMHLLGQLNRAPQVPTAQDPFPRLPQGHTQQSYALLNSSPSQHLQTSSASSATLTQVRHHLPFLPPPQPDLAHQTQPPQMSVLTEISQPPSGMHMIQGFSSTNHTNNPMDASGQANTSNLLAAIMKSGLLPISPANNLYSQNVQPPLPSGPPPIKALTSSAPSVTSLPYLASHGETPPNVPSIGRVVLPPLPPGPPPTTSQMATTSQFSNTSMLPPNPLSGLLNSLIAKGMISSTTELPTVSSPQIPNKLTDQNNSSLSTIPVAVPSTSTILAIPSSSVEKDISDPCAPTSATGLDNLIGLDFKPDIIREFHPLVVSSLFDDMKHQCTICGLRFRLNEQLRSHMDWHALKKLETGSFERVSQKWYADKSNWASTSVGPSCGATCAFVEDFAPDPEKCEEPMVPADENQSICALCGEPFEDFYSVERDEWMYKGTTYLSSALRPGDTESAGESSESGLIVHAKCVSSSVGNLK